MTLPTNTARAFNEWMRRFIDEPERFKTEYQTIADFMEAKLNDREPDYGDRATAYLQKILDEIEKASMVANTVRADETEPALA